MARLTPRDIQEKEFSSGFRGYKEEEVDEFLDRVTASYEEVFKEGIDLKEEVEHLMEENKKYELIGERMQAALVAAQETADDVRKNATKEAENILREAEIKAHKLVQESRDQHRELQKSLAIVKQIEEEFRFKLKSTLQSYLKLLDEIALGDMKEVQKWILPEDMAVMDERRREMESRKESAADALKAAAAVEAVKEAPAKIEEPKEEPAKVEEPKEEAAKVEEPKEEPKAEAKEEEVKPDKKEEEKEAAAKKVEEDSKAKAAALLEEIAAQAAAEEKEAAAAKSEVKEKPALDDTMPGRAADKPPFDEENAKASAVTNEWSKLQEAVAEVAKEQEKPKAAKVDEPKAEAPKTEAPKAIETTEAKPEPKEKKKGKVNLDDIEIVEDESFWKDI